MMDSWRITDISGMRWTRKRLTWPIFLQNDLEVRKKLHESLSNDRIHYLKEIRTALDATFEAKMREKAMSAR